MKKLSAALAASLIGVSLSANADVLDFNTASNTGGSSVPITTQTTPADGWGFIDETKTYNGFTFEYVPPAPGSGLPTSHSWIWVTEGSSGSGLQDRYETNNASNGFLAHGCFTSDCPFVNPSLSFAISNPTPFTFQSLKIARYSTDTAIINFYTNIGDTIPAESIALAPTNAQTPYLPVLVSNTGFANQLFTKITIDGFKGYYGIDDITYTPSPIPEASTYAMMLAGLGLVGFMARRRKQG